MTIQEPPRFLKSINNFRFYERKLIHLSGVYVKFFPLPYALLFKV